MCENFCWLCGSRYRNINFKKGYVCEKCIDYIKASSEKITDEDTNK